MKDNHLKWEEHVTLENNTLDVLTMKVFISVQSSGK